MKSPQEILARQAYHRKENDTDLAERFLRDRHRIPAAFAEKVDHLFSWFLTPLTLWPIPMSEVLAHVLDRIESGRRPDPAMILLLDLLPPLPGEREAAAVEGHEHDVQAGRYERFSPEAAAKFDLTEQELEHDARFQEDWRNLQARFDTDRFADEKGIIRRTMVPERNWRDFDLGWNKPASRFQAVFDAFCAKWNLYGMCREKPLLLKLSVNLTPYGTMIFIPAYWSFDAKRDLRWAEVNALHRARRPRRQGSTLAENQKQRRKDAVTLASLDERARDLNLRGAARHAFLCRGLGWDPRTDPKRIARLRATKK